MRHSVLSRLSAAAFILVASLASCHSPVVPGTGRTADMHLSLSRSLSDGQCVSVTLREASGESLESGDLRPSDRDGRLSVSLSGVAYGTYGVEVALKDRSAEPVVLLRRGLADGVAIDSPRVAIPISLDRISADVRGVIADYPGATVRVAGAEPAISSTIAEGGSFTLRVPTGRGIALEVLREEFLPTALGAITVQDDSPVDLGEISLAAQPVSEYNIAGIAAPVLGFAPVGSLDAAQYSGVISWSPSMSGTGTFAASTVYVATIALSPKAGYTLAGVTEDSFTMAGADLAYGAGSSIVTATFPATSDVYTIGAAGPAGGIVFYDKGSFSDGWRYMEAAPSDQGSTPPWRIGAAVEIAGATSTAIGAGKANTAAIVAVHGAGTYAARICSDYALGGYSGWFLPSAGELALMYQNLHARGLGGFNKFYWSSSQVPAPSFSFAYYRNFETNYQSNQGTAAVAWVRAVRSF